MRFSKFSEKWDYVLVSDLLETFSTNSLSWDMLDYDEGHIYNLHYGLIHSGLPTQIDCTEQKLPKIKPQYLPKNYTLCLDGDIAFADASEDTEEVGKVVEFFNSNKLPIVSGLHTIHCRDKENRTVIGYKGYAFSSVPFHHQVRRIAQGTKIYSINTKNFTELYVGIPSKAEQRKIADFLHLIDERIDTQSKIIEELLCLKNSICHTLFSNNAFFEGYAPISEYAVLKNGYAFKSTTYTENGSYKVITIANVTGERYYSTEKCNTINELPSDIQQHQVLKIGDILISLTGNVGRVSYCSKPNTLLNQRVGLLTVLKEEYKEYIYQVISACDFEKTMQSCGQGAAQMNIGKSDVESYLIPVPKTLKVAKQISDLLHSYDEKIQTEKDMLTTYKKQKAYLLSQMFI